MKYMSSRGKEKNLSFEDVLFAGNFLVLSSYSSYWCNSNYDRIICSSKNCAKIKFVLGYASDGGLYFPDTIPKLSEEQINHWSQLDYIDLVKVNH